MTHFRTVPSAAFIAASSTTAEANSERLCAQDAFVRYAEEIASLARDAQIGRRDDVRSDGGAIDSPLFANV